MLNKTILANLAYNEEFSKQVLHHMKVEYFKDAAEKVAFSIIGEYTETYGRPPTQEAMLIELDQYTGLNTNQFGLVKQLILDLKAEPSELQWLIDKTEKFCRKRAIDIALMKALDLKEDPEQEGKIPEMLEQALATCFDNSVGHDYLDDFEARFEYYHRPDERIPFDLDFFNRITNGGRRRKTLNAFMAGTGVGKSFAMCHMATADLMMGLNVLYITLEMSEMQIAERIDANFINVPLDELLILPKEMFYNKIAKAKSKVTGRLKIQEYPEATIDVRTIRKLLHDLKTKQNFIPDIIYVDYINLMLSSRMKGDKHNSYAIVMAIAQELRGLMKEHNCVGWTATQVNRSGINSTDFDLAAVADSIGLPYTLDLMLALITSDELKALGQVMVKQLKNRYAPKDRYEKFVIGADYTKMRLFDIEEDAAVDLHGVEIPVFDSTGFGTNDEERRDNKFRHLFDD